MKILNVAYPFARVRGDTAGGAEQVVSMLDRALAEGGHESYVVACEGSEVAGDLTATPLPEGPIDAATRRATWKAYRSAISRAVASVKPDLVHLHGIDFGEYLPEPGVPVVATLHLPPAWYDPEVFSISRPGTWLNCVSRSQQNACPRAANLLPFIPNGVPEDLRKPCARQRNFALCLGRICPEKGYHLALAAADKAGAPLLLAGEVYGYEAHQRYFNEQILPACDRANGNGARFIGPVGWQKKRRLLTSASCLLVPSLAPETSSLVAMEAAMCGTPAIAFRTGALPEIVQENVTGFLVDDADQMADAMRRCRDIDADACRSWALEHFSARGMTASYLRMYERLIRQ